MFKRGDKVEVIYDQELVACQIKFLNKECKIIERNKQYQYETVYDIEDNNGNVMHFRENRLKLIENKQEQVMKNQYEYKRGDKVKLIKTDVNFTPDQQRLWDDGNIIGIIDDNENCRAPWVRFEGGKGKIACNYEKLEIIVDNPTLFGIKSNSLHLLDAIIKELADNGYENRTGVGFNIELGEPSIMVNIISEEYFTNNGYLFENSTMIYDLPTEYNKVLELIKPPVFLSGEIVKCVTSVTNKIQQVTYNVGDIVKVMFGNQGGGTMWFHETPSGAGVFNVRAFVKATPEEIEKYNDTTPMNKLKKIFRNKYDIKIHKGSSLVIGCQTYSISQLETLYGLLNTGHITGIMTELGEIKLDQITTILNIIK